MKPNWYAAVRKSTSQEWKVVFGPFKTKREADAVHLQATMLISNMYPVEDLYGVVHATVSVSPNYKRPGPFNHVLVGLRRSQHSHEDTLIAGTA